ncbi:FKBP-type peptidyl-prolyl cis-trans isomerase [Myxococcaceae bacterium GXIMD 01537]
MRTTWMAAVLVGALATSAQAAQPANSKAKGKTPKQEQPQQQPPQAQAPAPGGGGEPKSDDERTFYALGYSFGRNLSIFGMSPEELAVLKRGLDDSVNEKPSLVDVDKFGPRIQEMARSRQAKTNETYLAKAAKEPGFTKLPSGILYKEVRAGTGASPKATDTVKVNYRGTLTNGTEFDSSYKRNQPAEFPLNGVIKCWTEGVQKMKVGGKAELICPPDTAYGERPPPGSSIQPNAVLRFDVELLGITAGAATGK